MRIVKLQAEHFKRLRVVEITPKGDVVTLAGRNRQGKSSVIDAIYAALGGSAASPEVPIAQGQEAAKIRLDLGEVIVTRKFTGKDSTVVVEAASGARFPSPQRMLDELINRVSFDPLSFTRQSAREQYETLRRLVKLEVDVDALAGLNKRDYDARAELNRTSRSLRAQAEGITDGAPVEAERADEEGVLQRLTDASAKNEARAREHIRRDNEAETARAERHNAAIKRGQAVEHRRRAELLDQEAKELEDASGDRERALDKLPALEEPVDSGALREELGTAKRTNAAIARRDRKVDLVIRADQVDKEAEALTAAMAARDVERSKALTNAKFPIADLAFGDGEVIYKNLPLGQASTAEQLRISMAVASAMNPKLRVVCIREGSFLDAEGLKLVAEMARKTDTQVWLEDNRSTDPMAIVMEDGQVRGSGQHEPASAGEE